MERMDGWMKDRRKNRKKTKKERMKEMERKRSDGKKTKK